MKIKTYATSIKGRLSVPGSKSHTIRAFIFAALADGESVIKNPLLSEDSLSTLRVIQEFGAKVTINKNEVRIFGVGTKWKQPGWVIDVGNSGTLLHFITGILSTIDGYSVITGDSSICTRPISQQLQGLQQLGATAFTTRLNVDAPPVIIKGSIAAGTTKLEGTLSQHVSGILLAGALSKGTTRIELSNPKEIPFVKMTILWLNSVGIEVRFDQQNFSWLEIDGPNNFPPIIRAIPSDWEGVAFPLAAAVLTNSELKIENIDCSGSQGDEAIVDVLREMGANIEINKHEESLIIKKGAPLKGICINCSDFPDALPILSVVAAFAEGKSVFTDIGVCRLKETDRIKLMRQELTKLGAKVIEGDDFLEVHGGLKLYGATVESHGDHRIAMALSVCGMAMANENVIVNNAECCSVSFPNFYDTMRAVGSKFESIDEKV